MSISLSHQKGGQKEAHFIYYSEEKDIYKSMRTNQRAKFTPRYETKCDSNHSNHGRRVDTSAHITAIAYPFSCVQYAQTCSHIYLSEEVLSQPSFSHHLSPTNVPTLTIVPHTAVICWPPSSYGRTAGVQIYLHPLRQRACKAAGLQASQAIHCRTVFLLELRMPG